METKIPEQLQPSRHRASSTSHSDKKGHVKTLAYFAHDEDDLKAAREARSGSVATSAPRYARTRPRERRHEGTLRSAPPEADAAPRPRSARRRRCAAHGGRHRAGTDSPQRSEPRRTGGRSAGPGLSLCASCRDVEGSRARPGAVKPDLPSPHRAAPRLAYLRAVFQRLLDGQLVDAGHGGRGDRSAPLLLPLPSARPAGWAPPQRDARPRPEPDVPPAAARRPLQLAPPPSRATRYWSAGPSVCSRSRSRLGGHLTGGVWPFGLFSRAR